VKSSAKITPIGLAVSLSLFGDLSLYSVLVTQLSATHLTLAQVGILLSIHRLIRIALNPLVGVLQNRVGRRPLFLVGLMLAVASTAAYGLISGFYPFLISRIGWGFAWALINVSGMTMILDTATSENRAQRTGTYTTWLWIGYMVGPLVGSIFSDWIGFRLAMLICAGLSAVGMLIGVLKTKETLPVPSIEKTFPSFRSTLGMYFSRHENSRLYLPAFILYGLVQFCGDGVTMATLTLLLTERLGQALTIGGLTIGAATAGGFLMTLRSILGATSSPIIGWLSDHHLGRKTIISGFLITGIASFLFLYFANSPIQIVLAIILGALANAAAWVTLPAIIGDHSNPDNLGSAMGRLAMAGDIGSTLGPVMAIGFIPFIGLGGIFIFCASLNLLGFGVWNLNSRGTLKAEVIPPAA
jgi:MFS family permease